MDAILKKGQSFWRNWSEWRALNFALTGLERVSKRRERRNAGAGFIAGKPESANELV